MLARAFRTSRRDAARWVLVAVLLLLTTGRGAVALPSESQGSARPQHTHVGTADVDQRSAPPVVRRLWSDLFCMCGDCEHMTLAECGCDNAAKERKRINEKATSLGLGSPEREEVAYAAVVKEYVQHHGANAEVSYVKLHSWLDPLLTLVAAVAGIVVMIVGVERWRSRSRRRERQAGSGHASKHSAKSHAQRGRRKHR